jgi:hypothetical protein
MVAFTRQQQEAAFYHVAKTILVLTKTEMTAFKDADLANILNFINMDDKTFSQVKITDTTNNTTTPLPISTQILVTVFMYYIHFLGVTGTTPVGTDWNNLSIDDFETFRQSSAFYYYKGKTLDTVASVNLTPYLNANTSTTATINSTTTTTTAKKVTDPVQEFDKGVKRDITVFPSLKDERNWDQFLRTTKAIARTQKMSNVLDSTYVPSTTEEKDLFERQQAYMYSVAESTLKTDKGQELVRIHEEQFDAQKIYKELTEYHAKSTKAIQNASDLLSYITSHRLGEDTWSGNTESYVVHWKETVRQYHELIPVNQRLAEEQQLVMLQNAVHPVPEL